jgi:hypothetical protein
MVFLTSASELIFKKKIMLPNSAVKRDSTVYTLQGSLEALEYLAPASVFAD